MLARHYLLTNISCRFLFLCRLAALFTLVFSALLSANQEKSSKPQKIFYPGHERKEYYIDLLQLALSYPCQQQYQLLPSKLEMPKKRAFDLMNEHNGIDVMYGSATNERIAEYRAVPFPIMRGLMGLRVALVSKEGKHKLKNIHSLSTLAKLRVGQFSTWSDTEILQANGFNVEAGSDLGGLYQMLARGRIDYFPRSVLEVQFNQQEHSSLQLEIDPYVLMYYPTAVYFYVAKDNADLAAAIQCGLEHAQKDGKLTKLFDKYYSGVLQQLNLENRRVIKLKNPLLPANVPLERTELWHPLPSNN